MTIKTKLTFQFFATTLAIFLVGCSSSGTDGIEGTGLRGTVAIGAPISNTKVIIKGSNGTTAETTTDQSGKYSVIVDGLTAPYFIKVEASSTKVLYSFANEAGVANVHPVSDLIVRNWLGVNARSADSIFSSGTSNATPPSSKKLTELLTAYSVLLKNIYGVYNVDTAFNPLTSEFSADSTGFDKLLDSVSVDVSNTVFNIAVTDPISSVQTILVNNFNFSNDFSTTDTAKPATPGGLNALSLDNSDLLLLWNAASDNIGIAKYNIYRDNNLIASTPFPVYTDTNVTTGTEYCYSIEALDLAGNVSNKSTQICATSDSVTDEQAPSKPSNLQATTLDQRRVQLTWTPSQSDDILGYHISRRTLSATATRIATVIASQYVNFDLNANTEYCYAIQAFDAQGNIADATAEVCATTLANAPTDTTAPSSNASPTGGKFTNSITVTLNCNDTTGSGCAGINYTTDGSEPSSSSTLYAGPIELTTTTTLKFIAIDVAGNKESTVHSETYTLSAANTNNTTATVQFSASNYSVTETIGAVEVVVIRTGDATQSASVDYAITDGSAKTTEDFIAIEGTLNWEANDTTNQSLFIPIKGDRKAESTESFTINLTQPSSAVILGDIASSTVTIENSECSNILAKDITVDTVISGCTFIDNSINIQNNANLTIEPGTTLVFDASAGFNVKTDGSLTAKGTAAKPILFTGSSHTPGYWSGVKFTYSNNIKNELEYVTMEYAGGSANLATTGSSTLSSRLSIKNCRLTDGAGYGFQFDEGTILTAFSNNIITRNELAAGKLEANIIRFLDHASRFSGNGKNYLEIDGSGNVKLVQTWPLIDVPYYAKYINIDSDLTLEAGTTLIFNDGGNINVDADGSLNAVGTAEAPILFTSISKTPGAWGGIQFTFSNDIKNVLDYVIVEYGGDRVNGTANVITFGGSGLPQRLKLTNSILRFSSSYGVEFSEGVTLTEFSNNTIVDNEGAPASVDLNALPSMDAESNYTGNGKPFIEVTGSEIKNDQTWKKLDVDYLVDNISVINNLTLEPGVKLIFRNNGYVNVRTDGALTAIGDTDSPVIFSCEDETRGAWQGIQFTFSNSGNNKLINSVVEYAGGPGGNGEGSVRLYGSNSIASRAEIRNTTVQSGDSYAIWLDQDSTINSDVDTVNSFIDNEFDSVFRN